MDDTFAYSTPKGGSFPCHGSGRDQVFEGRTTRVGVRHPVLERRRSQPGGVLWHAAYAAVCVACSCLRARSCPDSRQAPGNSSVFAHGRLFHVKRAFPSARCAACPFGATARRARQPAPFVRLSSCSHAVHVVCSGVAGRCACVRACACVCACGRYIVIYKIAYQCKYLLASAGACINLCRCPKRTSLSHSLSHTHYSMQTHRERERACVCKRECE